MTHSKAVMIKTRQLVVSLNEYSLIYINSPKTRKMTMKWEKKLLKDS
jgi:hypothetical protein